MTVRTWLAQIDPLGTEFDNEGAFKITVELNSTSSELI